MTMGPKKVRIDPDAVYQSSTPAAVQQKFPCRRRSVKSNNSVPPKPREQSTLTQLDWSFSTEPSSEIGDEDDDDRLERPTRKRRRRTLSDGKRQTTLTQLVGSSFEEAMDGAADEMVVEWDGNDMVRDSQSSQIQDQDGREEEEYGQQHVKRQGTRVNSAREKFQSRQSPSPELAVSVSMPCVRTPGRRFPSEIPSSSTPQSAVLSTQEENSLRSPDRSPLRSRSANVWLQQEPSQKAPLSPILDTPPKPVSQFRLSPAKSHPIFRIPEKPPSLQHHSTIPDSDDTATQISPPHKRKFPSQIPDTQFHLFGHEVTADTETQFNYTCDAGGETYNSSDFVGYDPACSALDRDAARFMQTQRLQDLRRQQTSNILFTQEEPPVPKPTQHSPELGAEAPATSKPSVQETETEAETQSLPLSQPKLPPEEEIEVVDLTESFIPRENRDMEIIRIASSIASSSDIPDDKYPSSPPLGPTSPEIHHVSSPLPLPLLEVTEGRFMLAPSQISTVAGTQAHGWLKREMVEVDTSTPPLPPSTSSPPAGVKRVKVADSEDEDEDEGGDDDDGDLDLGVSFWGRAEVGGGGGGEVGANDHGNEEDGERDRQGGERDGVDEDEDEEEEEEEEEEEGDTTIRDLRDILPDTLLDFSLPPPPPTQSSVRSSWK